jgi:flagellar biosynthesis/type III secretory pathway chaperone
MAKLQPASPPVTAAADLAPRTAITAVIALLEHEQQLLAQPQADALAAVAAQKQALLQQMEASVFATRGALNDPAVRALVRHAQRLNATNARLLALHRTCCENRLHQLRGTQSSHALYSASGYLGA